MSCLLGLSMRHLFGWTHMSAETPTNVTGEFPQPHLKLEPRPPAPHTTRRHINSERLRHVSTEQLGTIASFPTARTNGHCTRTTAAALAARRRTAMAGPAYVDVAGDS